MSNTRDKAREYLSSRSMEALIGDEGVDETVIRSLLSELDERDKALQGLVEHWRETAPYCETVDDASALCDCADELQAILLKHR